MPFTYRSIIDFEYFFVYVWGKGLHLFPQISTCSRTIVWKAFSPHWMAFIFCQKLIEYISKNIQLVLILRRKVLHWKTIYIDFWMSNQLCISQMNSSWSWYFILLICYWIWKADIFLKFFYLYSCAILVISFLLMSLNVLGDHGYVVLISVQDCYYFTYLIEFTSRHHLGLSFLHGLLFH